MATLCTTESMNLVAHNANDSKVRKKNEHIQNTHTGFMKIHLNGLKSPIEWSL